MADLQNMPFGLSSRAHGNRLGSIASQLSLTSHLLKVFSVGPGGHPTTGAGHSAFALPTVFFDRIKADLTARDPSRLIARDEAETTGTRGSCQTSFKQVDLLLNGSVVHQGKDPAKRPLCSGSLG